MQKMLSAEIWTISQTSHGCAVLLQPRELGVAVPVFIGQLEMESILIGKEGLVLPRPLTHDLFLNMLYSLKLTLERVEVHELKDNTFHARLVISGGEYTEDNPLVMDSRPSDAFALAVRRRCPILVAPRVVEQAGIPLDYFIDEMAGEADEPKRPAPEKHRKLLEQLNQAVAAEEYEQAAEIRDMLNMLNDEDSG